MRIGKLENSRAGVYWRMQLQRVFDYLPEQVLSSRQDHEETGQWNLDHFH